MLIHSYKYLFNPFENTFNPPGVSFNLPGASAANPSRIIYGFIFFFNVAHFCLAAKGGGGE